MNTFYLSVKFPDGTVSVRKVFATNYEKAVRFANMFDLIVLA